MVFTFKSQSKLQMKEEEKNYKTCRIQNIFSLSFRIIVTFTFELSQREDKPLRQFTMHRKYRTNNINELDENQK